MISKPVTRCCSEMYACLTIRGVCGLSRLYTGRQFPAPMAASTTIEHNLFPSNKAPVKRGGLLNWRVRKTQPNQGGCDFYFDF
jgi:hypothetical protein